MKKEKRKFEYSKCIVFFTSSLFLLVVLVAIYFTYVNIDTMIFSYIISVSGGMLGSSIIFYFNKAKIENVCKGKIEFFKFKMDYLAKHPEHKPYLDAELNVIDEALTCKLNNEIETSINEDIDMPMY